MNWKTVLAGALLCTVLTGCGSSAEAPAPADAIKSLQSELTFTDQMTDLDSEGACRFYDLDATLVADSAAYVGSGATAESLAAFTAKDSDSADQLVEALGAFVDGWIEGYSSYKPEEVPKLESAVIDRQGETVVFCVTDDNAAAKDAVQAVLHP